jgi:hypothetical protein
MLAMLELDVADLAATRFAISPAPGRTVLYQVSALGLAVFGRAEPGVVAVATVTS